jgi:hypothetical protein
MIDSLSFSCEALARIWEERKAAYHIVDDTRKQQILLMLMRAFL